MNWYKKAQQKQPWEMTKKEWVQEQGKLVSGQSVRKTMQLANLLHKDYVKIWLSKGKILYDGWEKDYPNLDGKITI